LVLESTELLRGQEVGDGLSVEGGHVAAPVACCDGRILSAFGSDMQVPEFRIGILFSRCFP
jgi:hypothetical protein